MKILEVCSITKTFGNTTALRNVSFSADKGEFIVIGGANGSGKSVLMSIIAGLEKSDSGSIIKDKSTRVGLVFQDADAQILGETPEEDIAFGLRNTSLSKDEIKALTASLLKKFKLEHKASSPARLLSGGEKRRLSVAGITALKCSIFIFDEPFANLDWDGIRQVCTLLKGLKEEGRTVIVLTHELEKILALADRFMILNKGELVFDGPPQEGLNLGTEKWGIRNPLVSYTSVKDMLWM